MLVTNDHGWERYIGAYGKMYHLGDEYKNCTLLNPQTLGHTSCEEDKTVLVGE